MRPNAIRRANRRSASIVSDTRRPTSNRFPGICTMVLLDTHELWAERQRFKAPYDRIVDPSIGQGLWNKQSYPRSMDHNWEFRQINASNGAIRS